MNFRFRVLGLLIVACGLAVCYGAMHLWPGVAFASYTVVDVLRLVGAVVAAALGVLNVVAGFAVVLLKPARG